MLLKRIPVLVFALLAQAAAAPSAPPETPPNLVVILADDLGIECLPSYGGTSHETPHLDALARQGMRFTHCFSHPYCSPSRASLLTGRYPFANGIREVIYDLNRHADIHLHVDQPSFARQLQAGGYATAIAGKWQLSFLHQRNTIGEFGFDQYQCWQIFRADGTKTRRFHQPHFIRNGEIVADEIRDRFGPDANVDFLIRFMKANAARKRPFLAYHTCLLPHFPWVPTPDSTDQEDPVRKATDQGDPKFFPDMVRHLDKNVGRIVKAIDDLGIADNTMVVFVADNGTDRRLHTSWGDGKTISGGKGSMTDRGTRVPLIVRWTGHIAPGTTCDDLVDFTDFFPTFCELAGADLPDAPLHGRSFAPRLLGRAGHPRDWVHVQNKESRHVRNREYILDDSDRLRPVVEIWQDPAKPNQHTQPEKEQAARRTLQAAFDALDAP